MAGLENLGMICYSNAVLHALGNAAKQFLEGNILSFSILFLSI